ncbi:hypothetical protein BDW62DRAFT_175931 [Aspergillus aurantiobrunneus]
MGKMHSAGNLRTTDLMTKLYICLSPSTQFCSSTDKAPSLAMTRRFTVVVPPDPRPASQHYASHRSRIC